MASVGKLAFQPLTPMFHMLDLRQGQPAYMEQIARAFESLRHGVTRVHMEYEASPLAVRPVTCFVPHPLTDSARRVQECATMHSVPCRACTLPSHSIGVAISSGTTRRWSEVQHLLNKDSLLFFAHDAHMEKPMVVKYVTKYGTEVHQALSDAGLAPVLYDTVQVKGGFIQVNFGTTMIYATLCLSIFSISVCLHSDMRSMYSNEATLVFCHILFVLHMDCTGGNGAARCGRRVGPHGHAVRGQAISCATRSAGCIGERTCAAPPQSWLGGVSRLPPLQCDGKVSEICLASVQNQHTWTPAYTTERRIDGRPAQRC